MVATAEPIEIIVDVIDNVSDELREIRAQLELLDQTNIDISFEIHDEAEFATTEAKIKALESQGFNLDLDIDDDLKGDLPTESEKAIDDLVNRHIGKSTGRVMSGFDDEILDIEGFGPHGTGDRLELGHHFRTPDALPDPMEGFSRQLSDAELDIDFDLQHGFARVLGAEPISDAREELTGMRETVSELVPSMMDYWQVLALIIPVMITLIGAAIGLAAALGTVATAGAALLGLGLIGWGDTFGDSISNLADEATKTGEEIFGVLQPVAAEAQPFMQDWLQGAPHQVERIADELDDLLRLAPNLEAMGAGFVDWVEDVLQAMVDLREESVQVSMRMGGAIGDFILDGLSAMLKDVHRNQDAYIQLAEIFVDVIVILFNLAKAISFVLGQFEPLFDMFMQFSVLLNNPLVVGMLTFLTTIYAVRAAALALTVAINTLSGSLLRTAISSITSMMVALQGLIATMLEATVVSSAMTASLLGAFGAGILGLGAVGLAGGLALSAMGSMTGPSGGGGSGSSTAGGNTYISIEGDARKRDIEKLIDKQQGTAQSEMSLSAAMEGNR